MVDAPSLLHRNHHARAHTGLRDRAGRPIWALHGMLRQILESIDTIGPDAVLFGLDDRTASVRRDAYPDYKAGRAEKDAELVDQLDRAGALLDALGLATLTPPGLEADDVNASGATWATANGWNCVIITSDRDAFAHISGHTQVLRLIDGGIHGSPMLNPARLFNMYGVRAANYLAFAALRGDSSDNLPGVQGIGEKTAAILLDVAGSMDAAWSDVDHNEGRALAEALDDWATEIGWPPPRRDRRTTPARGRRPRALRLQRADDVGPGRPRPRPHSRRPGLARAAAARPGPGDEGGRLPRQRLHHRPRGAGADGPARVGLRCQPVLPPAAIAGRIAAVMIAVFIAATALATASPALTSVETSSMRRLRSRRPSVPFSSSSTFGATPRPWRIASRVASSGRGVPPASTTRSCSRVRRSGSGSSTGYFAGTRPSARFSSIADHARGGQRGGHLLLDGELAVGDQRRQLLAVALHQPAHRGVERRVADVPGPEDRHARVLVVAERDPLGEHEVGDDGGGEAVAALRRTCSRACRRRDAAAGRGLRRSACSPA